MRSSVKIKGPAATRQLRRGRGVAATLLHGLSTSRRRDSINYLSEFDSHSGTQSEETLAEDALDAISAEIEKERDEEAAKGKADEMKDD